MKRVLPLIFLTLLSATALANPRDNHDKIYISKMDLFLDHSTIGDDDSKKTEIDSNQKVARLYRRKNSLVKKALDFNIIKSSATLA